MLLAAAALPQEALHCRRPAHHSVQELHQAPPCVDIAGSGPAFNSTYPKFSPLSCFNLYTSASYTSQTLIGTGQKLQHLMLPCLCHCIQVWPRHSVLYAVSKLQHVLRTFKLLHCCMAARHDHRATLASHSCVNTCAKYIEMHTQTRLGVRCRPEGLVYLGPGGHSHLGVHTEI